MRTCLILYSHRYDAGSAACLHIVSNHHPSLNRWVYAPGTHSKLSCARLAIIIWMRISFPISHFDNITPKLKHCLTLSLFSKAGLAHAVGHRHAMSASGGACQRGIRGGVRARYEHVVTSSTHVVTLKAVQFVTTLPLHVWCRHETRGYNIRQ